MTHKDIYTKFMIEYDKANLTSSYPSLTEYEVATVLDKAYNALIAQKITGNNYRRSTLESDIKSTADLEPLIRRKKMTAKTLRDLNVMYADQPKNMLYYIEALLYTNGITLNKDTMDASASYNPYDGIALRTMPAQLVTHKAAEKFIVSSSNLPWVKNPVCYLENNKIFFVYDPINKPLLRNSEVGLNENNQATPVVTASLYSTRSSSQPVNIKFRDYSALVKSHYNGGKYDINLEMCKLVTYPEHPVVGESFFVHLEPTDYTKEVPFAITIYDSTKHMYHAFEYTIWSYPNFWFRIPSSCGDLEITGSTTNDENSPGGHLIGVQLTSDPPINPYVQSGLSVTPKIKIIPEGAGSAVFQQTDLKTGMDATIKITPNKGFKADNMVHSWYDSAEKKGADVEYDLSEKGVGDTFNVFLDEQDFDLHVYFDEVNDSSSDVIPDTPTTGEQITITTTCVPQEGGSILVPTTPSADVLTGQDLSIKVVPNTGYQVVSCTVNDTWSRTSGFDDYFLIPSNETQINVKATFANIVEEPTPLSISTSVSPANAGFVQYTPSSGNVNDTIQAKLVPNSGYKASKIKVNDTWSKSIDSNVWTTIPTYQQNIAIVGEFAEVEKEQITCTGLCSPSNGGVIQFDKSTYYEGDTIRVRLLVSPGYEFVNFNINGTALRESEIVGTWHEFRTTETSVIASATLQALPTPVTPDDEDNPYIDGGQYGDFEIVYIKTPNKFVKDLQNPQTGWVSYFDWSTAETPEAYKFECNETMAEELISLAVMFALENVESQRLGTKLNMRGLEA